MLKKSSGFAFMFIGTWSFLNGLGGLLVAGICVLAVARDRAAWHQDSQFILRFAVGGLLLTLGGLALNNLGEWLVDKTEPLVEVPVPLEEVA